MSYEKEEEEKKQTAINCYGLYQMRQAIKNNTLDEFVPITELPIGLSVDDAIFLYHPGPKMHSRCY